MEEGGGKGKTDKGEQRVERDKRGGGRDERKGVKSNNSRKFGEKNWKKKRRRNGTQSKQKNRGE